MKDGWIKQANGLGVSLFRPQWRNLLNLILITCYKDFSPECSGLHFSRNDYYSIGPVINSLPKDLFYYSLRCFDKLNMTEPEEKLAFLIQRL